MLLPVTLVVLAAHSAADVGIGPRFWAPFTVGCWPVAASTPVPGVSSPMARDRRPAPGVIGVSAITIWLRPAVPRLPRDLHQVDRVAMLAGASTSGSRALHFPFHPRGSVPS